MELWVPRTTGNRARLGVNIWVLCMWLRVETYQGGRAFSPGGGSIRLVYPATPSSEGIRRWLDSLEMQEGTSLRKRGHYLERGHRQTGVSGTGPPCPSEGEAGTYPKNLRKVYVARMK